MPTLMAPTEITKALPIYVMVPEIKPDALCDVDIEAAESLLEPVVVVLVGSLLVWAIASHEPTRAVTCVVCRTLAGTGP